MATYAVSRDEVILGYFPTEAWAHAFVRFERRRYPRALFAIRRIEAAR
jgi:hypothetical protein